MNVRGTRIVGRVLGLSAFAFLAAGFSAEARADFVPPIMADDAADTAPTFLSATDASEEDFAVDDADVVLDLDDHLSQDDIAKLGAELGTTLDDNSPQLHGDGNVYVAHHPSGGVRAKIAALLGGHDSRIEVAEPLMRIDALFTPNDPKYGEQWHMTRVGAEKAWEYTCGSGVTVAVIDTGVACYDKAPFMKGTDLATTSCTDGYNFVGKNDMAADDHGHGTHVAGTIAQSTHNAFGAVGLAHCATLMPIKVLSKGGYGSSADVAEGIRFAADHGAQIINMSLGSPSKSGVIEKAVNYALDKGVVVVAAAGNSGRSVGYPAAYPGVVAVSATDRNDKVAWFSSRGPEVVIGAPGVAVVQQTVCNAGTNKCEVFGSFNGTSMAAPHVAAAAALVEGMGVTEPSHVRAALESSATPKEEKNLFGAGILDAAAAVRRIAVQHFIMRLGLALGLLALIARRIKKKGGNHRTGIASGLGLMMGSVGLVPFLPLLGIAGRFGNHRTVFDLLSRPVGEWDLSFSIAAHKYLLLASAAPALACALLCFHVKPLRNWLGGFSIGAAALAASLMWTGESAFFLGPFAMRIWLGLSVVVSLWLARVSLDRKSAKTS